MTSFTGRLASNAIDAGIRMADVVLIENSVVITETGVERRTVFDCHSISTAGGREQRE